MLNSLALRKRFFFKKILKLFSFKIPNRNHASWVTTQFVYAALYDHKIVFEMRKTYDLGSYVALDDISITDGRCDEPVTCDFDDDICSYGSSNQKYDFDFARFVGEFSICFLGLKDSFIKQHFSIVVPKYFFPFKSFNIFKRTFKAYFLFPVFAFQVLKLY